jgi:hypothetical protein
MAVGDRVSVGVVLCDGMGENGGRSSTVEDQRACATAADIAGKGAEVCACRDIAGGAGVRRAEA